MFRYHFRPDKKPAALIALTVISVACGAAPRVARADPAADALLSEVNATLQNAHTLTAEFVISTVHPKRYSDTQERGKVTLYRPNLARIEITRYRKPVDADRWVASGNGSMVVADGQNAHTLIWHPKSAQYRTIVETPAVLSRTLNGLEPLGNFFGSPTASDEARTVQEKTWENERYSVVREEGRASGSNGFRELYIGGDHLIHRVVERLNVDNKPVEREIILRNLKLDATVGADTFTFAPPANATPIDTVPAQPLLSPGTQAPDFAVEDSAGKTVRLSDYRGKIVLLKFFATWCWTCKESLPDTNRLAERTTNQDVVVLAVDIWNGREAFRAWTARTPYYAIHFAHDDHPQGKDAASVLYHVNTLPTEFVIGKDGRIVARSTGYEGPSGALEKAIAESAGQQVSRTP